MRFYLPPKPAGHSGRKKQLSFEQWMAAVDARIAQQFGGFISADLPDVNYRFMYDAGDSARVAAEAAIEYATEF